VVTLLPFKGYLYAGTDNTATGAEVWGADNKVYGRTDAGYIFHPRLSNDRALVYCHAGFGKVRDPDLTREAGHMTPTLPERLDTVKIEYFTQVTLQEEK
jgi:hypothetical protein